MKNIIKICILALLFVACDETESVVFDSVNGQANAAFDVATSRLPVIINTSGEVEVQVNVTTVSTIDRVVSISVDESSTANPENYSVPASVVIPAGEFLNTIVITGIDNSIETDIETIVLNIDSIENGVSNGRTTHTISLFEVCPVPAEYFVGTYMVQDVTATVGPGNGTENFEARTVTVSIPVDANGMITDATARTFTTGILPAFAGDRNVVIGLVCGAIDLQTVNPNLTCDAGANSYLFIGAGDNNTLYDQEAFDDDDSFLINYTEDPDGSCGGPFMSSVMLTKIQ